ncbi:hypothetical protein [Streptomyces sp. NPDC057418]|uniref:hypothetical protein n=1 Tax=unclassified Streptomyces TaxID=2593676 RepID=UPI00369249AA
MSRRSEEFRSLWASREVGDKSFCTKRLQHPVISNVSPSFRADTGRSCGTSGPWVAFRQPTRFMGGHCHRASMTSGRGRHMRSAAYRCPAAAWAASWTPGGHHRPRPEGDAGPARGIPADLQASAKDLHVY